MTMWQPKIAACAASFLVVTAGAGFALVGPGQSAPVRADPPPAAEPDPASVARRVWAVMDVVRKNHLEPPPPGDMALASAKSLLKASGAAAPDDLTRRAAAVTTEGELAALFRQLWPGGGGAKLEAAVLDGLLEGIPGRPHLLPADRLKVEEQLRGNRYVGIGVQLAANEQARVPQITNPFRRGAARTAGARPGDLIVQVDGKDTEGVAMEKVVEWLRGGEGTAVTVVVRQPDAAESRALKLTRAVIPIDSVLGYRRASEDGWDYRIDRDAGIAYVWVTSVKSSTLHELRQAERRLRADGARAVVLDFRFGESGSNLNDVALVADGLLDGGGLWSVRGADGRATEYRADREALFRGWPLVALVNRTHDNGQCLVLAALKDNGRAALVGEPTAGDGLVRSLVRLPDEQTGVTLITGRLERTGKERGWPVRPDHAVALGKDQAVAVRKWLHNKLLPELPTGTDDRPPEDPQLDRALAVLREALKAK